ncbi:serine carboxypeptidase-like 35 [Olea europaea var. sylvestris]|uniref:serine carboxypeptidase-like 35 n=1 Tax=Olea europaea var. sylvestris TaxID=158386 RepID=UPI000C1D550C|nr:serine carboxypeptidase-like 35 [Olea europaea var. sylvestris]
MPMSLEFLEHGTLAKTPYFIIGRTCRDTVLPKIKKLMASGIPIWIYSGYTDGRVSVTATQYSLKNSGCSKDSMVLLVPPW